MTDENLPLDAPFVPRRGRWVAGAISAATAIIFTVVAILLPGPDQGGVWRTSDKIMLIVFGLAMAAFLARYTLIRAVPRPDVLVIRNLFGTREVPWGQIEAVTFGGGMPWPKLYLVDGDEVGCMAIQRADGEFGTHEAERLATLVKRHQRS
ncbi:PH domain-containing protein [Kribbia dieselivorans]|uniref:PH domain-containing protein n=1 Tax=Kribbia dieselivorans TaxID=331526 RepID=UPI0009F92322|nr:PH domain-containing protein [Kribbia dieselivorans]